MPRREIRSWLMDMDGVLVHEEAAIPGADRFIARLVELGLPFLVLRIGCKVFQPVYGVVDIGALCVKQH